MLRRTTISISIIMLLTACGCATQRAPVFSSSTPSRVPASTIADDKSSWVLDSLRPDEQTTLVEGQTTPISVHMAASGNGHYMIKMEANKKQFRPFFIEIAHGVGEADFSGKMTWFVKPKKRNEEVVVSLYCIEEDDSGKIQHYTLLKQCKRRYSVICNKQEFAVLLLIKVLFRLCDCKP